MSKWIDLDVAERIVFCPAGEVRERLQGCGMVLRKGWRRRIVKMVRRAHHRERRKRNDKSSRREARTMVRAFVVFMG